MCNRPRLYDILPPLGAKTPEPVVRRLPYALHHHDQITPLHRVALRVLIILRQFEAACLQTLHIHHHAAVLGMQQLHQTAAPADEDEYVTIAYVALHLLMHHTAERADALAHISPPWTQKVAHSVIQAEHGS